MTAGFQQWGKSIQYGTSIAAKKPLMQALHEWGFAPEKSGNRHKMVCPFHDDENPSLVVYPDERWWCFGCSTGGDVIDFAMKFENLTFIEALAAYATLDDNPVPRELLNQDRQEMNLLSVVAYWARQAGRDADPFIERFRELYRAGRVEAARVLAENLLQGVDSVTDT